MKDLKDINPNKYAVGFVIHADGTFEFANPCCIPLHLIEEYIKSHKEKKPKKNEITVCAFIKIPKEIFK